MALDFLSISDLKLFISVLMSINEDVQVSFDFLFWFDRPVNRSLRFSNLCSMFLEKASKVLNIFDVVWTRVSTWDLRYFTVFGSSLQSAQTHASTSSRSLIPTHKANIKFHFFAFSFHPVLFTC